MATFNDFMEMGMSAKSWQEGVDRIASIIKVIDLNGADQLREVAWDAYRTFRMNKDNGTETEEMKKMRKYALEIWDKACTRQAYLEDDLPYEVAKQRQNARRRWR